MGIPPVHQEPPGVRCRRKGWLGTAVSLPLVLAFLLTVFHKVDAFLGPLSWTSYRGRTGRSQQPLLQAATRWSETEGPPVIRTLLIDNYDSYTYNLVNYLATVNGVAPLVVYNDAYDGDWEALVKAVGPFDNIVLSPGPGTPKNPADFGLCLNALQQSTIPVLGICLGHQGLAHLYGAKVERLEGGPMHGRLSPILHSGKGIFRGLPQGFQVVRYHSLVVDRATLAEQGTLEETAWTPDGVIMGLEHRNLPQYGVQFHPESVATQYGHALLANFRDLTLQHMKMRTNFHFQPGTIQAPTINGIQGAITNQHQPSPVVTGEIRRSHELLVRKVSLPEGVDSEMLFRALYGQSNLGAFWLDSSSSQGKYSFMGDASGPMGHVVEYITATTDEAAQETLLKVRRRDGRVEVHRGQSVLAYLKSQLSSWRQDGLRIASVGPGGKVEPVEGREENTLPFDFRGGYVGYLGYELQHDCLRIQQDRSVLEWQNQRPSSLPTSTSEDFARDVPDAVLTFADRFMAIDHEAGQVYIMALNSSPTRFSREDALSWQDLVESRIQCLQPVAGASAEWGDETPGGFVPMTSRAEYKAQVAGVFEALLSGDSYEICLTNAFLLPQAGVNPHQLYYRLRRQNPAPYSAFLLHDPTQRLGSSKAHKHPSSSQDASVAVCCSSPERFLKVSQAADGHWIVESKPIKGTMRRGLTRREDQKLAKELADSDKNRAENLMIVDLVRNDLARVCEAGSVEVPSLMNVESYATVHQLVSTVRGRLQPQKDIIDTIVASFPGGSMTGAPKVRTMAIINKLEKRPRGVYSGTLGFLSVDGAADLNIVIRTAVVTPQNVTVSAGGAVVWLSSAEQEYNEMMLKARAVTRVISKNEIPEEIDLLKQS